MVFFRTFFLVMIFLTPAQETVGQEVCFLVLDKKKGVLSKEFNCIATTKIKVKDLSGKSYLGQLEIIDSKVIKIGENKLLIDSIYSVQYRDRDVFIKGQKFGIVGGALFGRALYKLFNPPKDLTIMNFFGYNIFWGGVGMVGLPLFIIGEVSTINKYYPRKIKRNKQFVIECRE